jgi:hypothetical protein
VQCEAQKMLELLTEKVLPGALAVFESTKNELTETTAKYDKHWSRLQIVLQNKALLPMLCTLTLTLPLTFLVEEDRVGARAMHLDDAQSLASSSQGSRVSQFSQFSTSSSASTSSVSSTAVSQYQYKLKGLNKFEFQDFS